MNKTLYKATGRYMDGQKLVGYHLVGEDGTQLKEGKERIIYLIGKGLIENMRIQNGTDGLIIRGKGVNLNELPVFDINKGERKRDKDTKFGQYKITKRIMSKNECLGYEVVDYNGKIYKKRRTQILELAEQKLISNATCSRNGDKQYILRGVGCDLSKLPVLIVDNTGNIVDPLEFKAISVRATFMRGSGVVHDFTNNRKINFKSGDFIVYSAGGILSVISSEELTSRYNKSNTDKAVCDDYLNLASRYGIEIFGKSKIELNADIVRKWPVLLKKDLSN